MRRSRQRHANRKRRVPLALITLLGIGTVGAIYWHHAHVHVSTAPPARSSETAAKQTDEQTDKQTDKQTSHVEAPASQPPPPPPPPPQSATLPNLYTKTFDVSQKLTQQGVSVTLSKVVFLQQDMLAVVTFQNQSKQDVLFQAENTTAMQAGQTFPCVSNEQYPAPTAKLQAGATSKGILVFHGLTADKQVTVHVAFELNQNSHPLTTYDFSVHFNAK